MKIYIALKLAYRLLGVKFTRGIVYINGKRIEL